MTMTDLIISQPLAQALADYLAQRPFFEVHEFMAALQQLRRLPEMPKMEGSSPAG